MGLLNCAAGIATLLVAFTAGVNASSVTEAEVKAAVLYNLAGYIQWPEARASRPALVIGVLGPDAVLPPLMALQGKVVNGRALDVRQIRPEDDPASCDLLFIPATNERGAAALRRLGDAPVLTVSDGPQALRDGAAIRLYFERARLRLEVELDAIDRAQLKVSSKVLSLAKVLRNGSAVTSTVRP